MGVRSLRFKIRGLGFRVTEWVWGFQVLRVWSLEFGVLGDGLGVQGLRGCRVWGLGFGVEASGFRV